MTIPVKQQIVISGVGGQGVLFVTRLLAEAAIMKGLRVFTSETHGMAQRGGTVVSHLKVGNFSSPLIRPSYADGLLALKAENLRPHGPYMKEGGWAVLNHDEEIQDAAEFSAFTLDADTLAQEIGNPRSVNLVLLGFALDKVRSLFCSVGDIRTVLEKRLSNKKTMLASAVAALDAGCGK